MKRFVSRIILSSLLGSSSLLFSLAAQGAEASGYQPPEVPQYYEKGDGGYHQPVRTKKNYVYIEGLGGVGQSRPNGGETSSLSYGLGLKLGYVKALGSWSHFDGSLSIVNKSLAASHTEVKVPFGLLAQMGYGYTISGGVAAVAKFGIGLDFAKYHDDIMGYSRDYKNSIPSLALQAAYGFLVPLNESWLLDIGPAWTHTRSQVNGNIGTSLGPDENIDRLVVFNNFEFQFGIRHVL